MDGKLFYVEEISHIRIIGDGFDLIFFKVGPQYSHVRVLDLHNAPREILKLPKNWIGY